MNGNIYNYSLASKQYNWNGGSAYAIPPAPPGNISTITGEPIFTQSYINAYNTAFNQSNRNYQVALYKYFAFTFSDINGNFVPGTFGYAEEYNNNGERFFINYLTDNRDNYGNSPFIYFGRFRRGIWFYVFELDYSNLWSVLYCKCILKN